MKVTAFIRKTSAKNNVTYMARVYFRVRDKGGVLRIQTGGRYQSVAA